MSHCFGHGMHEPSSHWNWFELHAVQSKQLLMNAKKVKSHIISVIVCFFYIRATVPASVYTWYPVQRRGFYFIVFEKSLLWQNKTFRDLFVVVMLLWQHISFARRHMLTRCKTVHNCMVCHINGLSIGTATDAGFTAVWYMYRSLLQAQNLWKFHKHKSTKHAAGWTCRHWQNATHSTH